MVLKKKKTKQNKTSLRLVLFSENSLLLESDEEKLKDNWTILVSDQTNCTARKKEKKII